MGSSARPALVPPVATKSASPDTSVDVLTGSAGQDWYFANVQGGGVQDKITDLSAQEFAGDLDFIQAS